MVKAEGQYAEDLDSSPTTNNQKKIRRGNSDFREIIGWEENRSGGA